MMEQDRKEYLDKDESEKMCSSKIGEAGEMCSPADTDTCGDGCSFIPIESDGAIEIDLDLDELDGISIKRSKHGMDDFVFGMYNEDIILYKEAAP